MGNWQRRRRKRKERQGDEGGEEGGRRGTKERESIVGKTERLWMERMESLERVGLYLILVARRPMSNRGERDGGTTLGDGPTRGSAGGGHV